MLITSLISPITSLCRVVVFVDQMSELLDLALDKYHSLSDDERAELATYIIPEVSW